MLSTCLVLVLVAQAKPPVAERITANTYRFGAVTIDTQARTVTCPGVVNMDRGAIEYLAVAPGGKLHESLFRLDVRPLHLHLGLLLLGVEPKNGLQQQGDRRTPQGPPVTITIRWRDTRGNRQEVPAEALVAEMPKNRPMASGAWVFTGSRVREEGFEADLSKSLVAVWHDPAALVDNRLPGGANNSYVVNTKRVPRRGTRIEFVLKPVEKPEAQAVPEKKEPR